MIAKACDRYKVSPEWIAAKTERFRRWALSKDIRYVRWDQGWMNFMEPKEWERAAATNGHAAPGKDKFQHVWDRLNGQAAEHDNVLDITEFQR